MFSVRLDDRFVPLKLTYPKTFPNTVPSVRPVSAERLSGHQYGTADLCLQIRPDNWLPEYTGAMLVESSYELLQTENPSSDGQRRTAPSTHDVPDSIELRAARFRFYLPHHVLQSLRKEAPCTAQGVLWKHFCGDGYLVARLSSASADGWTWCDTSLPPALGADSFDSTVQVRTVACSADELQRVSDDDSLSRVLGDSYDVSKEPGYFLAVPTAGLPVLFRSTSETSQFRRFRTVAGAQETEFRSGEIRERLRNMRVAIVGLGSLGSKVAVSLARAGVGRFDLVDPDIVHMGNIERHDADWRDIGLHKVDVASRRIRLVSAHVVAGAMRTSVGAQVSATEMASVDGVLASCDLVLDATADPQAFNHLAAICVGADVTLIWGGVFAGGVGGFMARSRPHLDAHPAYTRQAMHDYLNDAKCGELFNVDKSYDGQNESGEFLVATDADVSRLASQITHLALDSLAEVEATEFHSPVYLLGFKNAWMFESPFHVQPINVDAEVRSRTNPEARIETESAFVNDLLEQKLNEVADRQAND